MFHQNDFRPVFSHDIACVSEQGCKARADEHEDNKAGIGSIGNSAALVVDILTERDLGMLARNQLCEPVPTDQAANDTTQIEDDPKHCNIFSFVLFAWVTHHNCPFCSPK